MPEAVSSNSTAESERQPRYGWDIHFNDVFEDIGAMMAAFNKMNSALHETEEDNSQESYGIYLIHRLIADRIKEVSLEVKRMATESILE